MATTRDPDAAKHKVLGAVRRLLDAKLPGDNSETLSVLLRREHAVLAQRAAKWDTSIPSDGSLLEVLFVCHALLTRWVEIESDVAKRNKMVRRFFSVDGLNLDPTQLKLRAPADWVWQWFQTEQNSIHIGVDASGSASTIALGPEKTAPAQVLLSRSIPSITNEEELTEAFRHLLTFGHENASVKAAIGAALYNSSSAARFERCLRRAIEASGQPSTVLLANDATTLLLSFREDGCLPDDLLVAIAGQGSVVLGRNVSGRWIRQGGTEWVASDFTGSAFDVARRALRSIQVALDAARMSGAAFERNIARDPALVLGLQLSGRTDVDELPSWFRSLAAGTYVKEVAEMASEIDKEADGQSDSSALARELIATSAKSLASTVLAFPEARRQRVVVCGSLLFRSDGTESRYCSILREEFAGVSETTYLSDSAKAALGLTADFSDVLDTVVDKGEQGPIALRSRPYKTLAFHFIS
ncbi:MAG: hypothetical protein ACK5CE_16925 [Actinomycetes bacterium]|uniref:Unannotated protein n=1 Tax=freshwater metagenome TaxID=449393 RepID=A0A6J6EKS1_9ZZZZ|nr:hypothetical protein [Actinomycetota bacterium]